MYFAIPFFFLKHAMFLLQLVPVVFLSMLMHLCCIRVITGIGVGVKYGGMYMSIKVEAIGKDRDVWGW